MVRGSSEESQPKREIRFKGIVADAKALKVSREHLYRVLSGQRRSQRLLKRYRELKGKGGEATGGGS